MNDWGPRSYRRSSVTVAIFMIAAGIILFLANLGLFPVHRVWDLWPLVFCAIGISRLIRSQSAGSIFASIILILLGTVFTLFSIGVWHFRLHDDSWPVALLLIGLGVAGVAKALDGEHPFLYVVAPNAWKRRRWYSNPAPGNANVPPTGPFLNDYTMMGNIKRRVESQDFQGGKLTCVMGNIEIDLRRARMPEGVKAAHIEVSAVMGRIGLRIPEAWRIIWMGENIMGNFEDKTIPPNFGPEAPQLTISGSCTMGEVEIEN